MPRSKAEPVVPLARALAQKRGARKKQARACALVAKWLKGESGYDEATWPILKAQLERSGRLRRGSAASNLSPNCPE